jgi:hypothetical protein
VDADGVFDIDGTDNPTNFQITGSITVGAWIKTTTVAAGSAAVICKENTNTVDVAYCLRREAGAIAFRASNDGSTAVSSTSAAGTISVNTWYHVVGIDASTQKHICLNGVQMDNDSTGFSTLFNSPLPLTIADRYNSASHGYFAGTIDEPFVTAEALTPAQIKHMYEVGKRALNQHTASRITGVTNADDYQKLLGGGTAAATVANTTAVAVDEGNQNVYVGTSDGAGNTGGVSVIGIDSDSVIDLFDATNNTTKDDDAGTLFAGNDVVSISVSVT